jgi:hypothetical protein
MENAWSDRLGGDLAIGKGSGAGGSAQAGSPRGWRGLWVSGAWTRVRLSESRCGDRQEQDGKRLPARPLIERKLG